MNDSFYLNEQHNPDILQCIANLSNDEVFTSPDLANRILDLLPQNVWSNKNLRFLDPFCKTGVFLREITKRLIKGLEKEIPNLEERITHILKNQVFGIAITELTSLVSRRTLYCSKYANSYYSVCRFDNVEGNIRFKRSKHIWKDKRCVFCGASQIQYDRAEDLENYAYEFIHVKDPKTIMNEKFDIIVGNPPFTLSDGGGDGSSSVPVYDKFVMQAIKMEPKYIAMIIQARWYSGGKGLNNFRNSFLNDDRVSIIHDYPETKDCFPGSNIRGGICAFLWDKNHKGDATIVNHIKDTISVAHRPLLENNARTFIRYNSAISIVRKVAKKGENTYNNIVSSRNPFGIPANFNNYSLAPNSIDNILLYRSVRGLTMDSDEKKVYISEKYILDNLAYKEKKKVLVCKASPGGDDYPHKIISKPIFSDINSVCTETYLILDFVDNDSQANNLISYMKTKFFRFLVLLVKNTQNISKECFAFVPVLDKNICWNDEMLYNKYDLSSEERAFIELMIKTWED